MDRFYESLLEGNRRFVKETNERDPDFFTELAKIQRPPVLWIGCADSRVPANQITGTNPGDVFVHRNIANMVVHTDMNMLSVLDYAVNQLKVEHIIVCGHYGCGGVQAAMGNQSVGLIDNWLRHIKDVYSKHSKELNAIDDEAKRFHALVELNVIEQVHALGGTSIVQKAWQDPNHRGPLLHGWVYDLHDGLIKELNARIHNSDELESLYQLALEADHTD